MDGASVNDTTLTFFTKATPDQWSFVLNLYRDVFKLHAESTRSSKKNGPAELIKLDLWYQEQLPKLIRERNEHQLFYDEIVQITKWKLLRGKFRPSILDLVKTNTETAVKNTTKKAFRKMPNINSAITALTQLKGIGPATASAILVAYSPNVCPYMADENMASTPGVEESDVSISEYLTYVEQTNACVERLRAQDTKTDWTPHKVELAIWTHYQIKQYNSNLLDDMPIPENISNSNEINNEVDNEVDNEVNNEANKAESTNECNEDSNNEDVRSQAFNQLNDENQVCSSNYEFDLNSNSNLIDSQNDEESSQNYKLDSNSLNNGVTQSDNELLNSNKQDSNDKNSSNINSNLDENSSNQSVVSLADDSSSNNNVSSSTNGILNQANNYKLNKLIANSNNELSSELNDSSNVSNNDKIDSSSVNQSHFIQLNSQDNLDSNLSLSNTNDSSEKLSINTISSSDNSNNINSSEDSILNNKKRSYSSSSSSLSIKHPRLNNCKDGLNFQIEDDNAIAYCSNDGSDDQLSKRQKLIN